MEVVESYNNAAFELHKNTISVRSCEISETKWSRSLLTERVCVCISRGHIKNSISNTILIIGFLSFCGKLEMTLYFVYEIYT